MGYDYLLVAICRLTSLVHLIPTTTSMKATENCMAIPQGYRLAAWST